MPGESAIEALVRFARLASEVRSGAAILPLLADVLVAQIAADSVAVLEIRQEGAKFVASPHLPAELGGLTLDPDIMGAELGKQLLAACGGRFTHTHWIPLVSGGGLFGSVVMFFTGQFPADRLSLAEGLVDVAAVALESAAKLQQLTQANADLRASQDALARTERLRALGQMAAGVSHDLKNILNPLSLHLQFVERAIDKGNTAGAKEGLEQMKQSLTRGVQTIERLRDYSRQSPEVRLEEIDLNRLVHEASEIARPRMASRRGRVNRIEEDLAVPPPKIKGRSGEILSAVVNLVVNAIDAMPDGGTIILKTGAAPTGAFAQVIDDGPGMPPEVERRLFEPFFTTKGEQGTGLGLAMVYACMQRHGGSVTLHTEPGKGTTFTLSFPTAGTGSSPGSSPPAS